MKYLVCKKENLSKIDRTGKIVETLAEALMASKEYDTIFLYDDTYYGKYVITTSHLTIIGVTKAKITYDVRNGMIVRKEDGGDGVKNYGTTGSASLTVKPSATYLHLENLIIENSYHRIAGNKGNQNVAFKTEAQFGSYYNVGFISEQDTLYIDASNNFFEKCYVEGDVDFIFGSGDAIINNSTIKMLQILDSNAYLCAPDTYVSNKYGFIFANCQVISVGNNKKYLGRAWYPGGAKEDVYPRVLFYNVSFPDDVDLRIITMHEGDPLNFEYYLIDCIQKKQKISNIEKNKLQAYFEYFEIEYNNFLINSLCNILFDFETLLHQRAIYLARMNYAIKDEVLEFQKLNYKLSYLKMKDSMLRSVPYNQIIESLDDKVYEAVSSKREEYEESKRIIEMTIEYIETAEDVNQDALDYAMRKIIRCYHPYVLGNNDKAAFERYKKMSEDFINEDLEALENIEMTNCSKCSDNTSIIKHIEETKDKIKEIKEDFPFDYVKNGEIDIDKVRDNYNKKLEDIKNDIAKVELRLEERAPINGLES